MVGAGNKNAINIGYNNSTLDSYLGHCEYYWCFFRNKLYLEIEKTLSIIVFLCVCKLLYIGSYTSHYFLTNCPILDCKDLNVCIMLPKEKTVL